MVLQKALQITNDSIYRKWTTILEYLSEKRKKPLKLAFRNKKYVCCTKSNSQKNGGKIVSLLSIVPQKNVSVVQKILNRSLHFLRQCQKRKITQKPESLYQNFLISISYEETNYSYWHYFLYLELIYPKYWEKYICKKKFIRQNFMLLQIL